MADLKKEHRTGEILLDEPPAIGGRASFEALKKDSDEDEIKEVKEKNAPRIKIGYKIRGAPVVRGQPRKKYNGGSNPASKRRFQPFIRKYGYKRVSSVPETKSESTTESSNNN